MRLELIAAGSASGFTIYALPGVREFLEALSGNDEDSTIALLEYVATQGIPRNDKKCNSEGDGFFALKPGRVRLLFFYEPDLRRVIVVTHGYFKQGQKMPRREFRRAEKLRAEVLEAKDERNLIYEGLAR